MAAAFTHLTRWLWRGKPKQESIVQSGTSLNATADSGLWEPEALKFPLGQMGNMKSYSRPVKRKWHSREERKLDKEYDVVLVPSDGGCFSGSESDDSDWSIGWLEPHGHGFQSDDDDSDDSFAVLVPCYAHSRADSKVKSKDTFPGVTLNISDLYAGDNKKNMEEWLTSLHNI